MSSFYPPVSSPQIRQINPLEKAHFERPPCRPCPPSPAVAGLGASSCQLEFPSPKWVFQLIGGGGGGPPIKGAHVIVLAWKKHHMHPLPPSFAFLCVKVRTPPPKKKGESFFLPCCQSQPPPTPPNKNASLFSGSLHLEGWWKAYFSEAAAAYPRSWASGPARSARAPSP